MSLAHYLNVAAHVLAALFWLGGMWFLALVGAPVLRREEPALRARLFHELGVRFRTAGWIAIVVLVATGVANLHFLGLLDADLLLSSSFWSGRYGRALAWKLAAVVAMLAVSAVHDFVLGPAAARAAPGDARPRRRAAWLARANALLGILLVLAAVRLARGG